MYIWWQRKCRDNTCEARISKQREIFVAFTHLFALPVRWIARRRPKYHNHTAKAHKRNHYHIHSRWQIQGQRQRKPFGHVCVKRVHWRCGSCASHAKCVPNLCRRKFHSRDLAMRMHVCVCVCVFICLILSVHGFVAHT